MTNDTQKQPRHKVSKLSTSRDFTLVRNGFIHEGKRYIAYPENKAFIRGLIGSSLICATPFVLGWGAAAAGASVNVAFGFAVCGFAIVGSRVIYGLSAYDVSSERAQGLKSLGIACGSVLTIISGLVISRVIGAGAAHPKEVDVAEGNQKQITTMQKTETTKAEARIQKLCDFGTENDKVFANSFAEASTPKQNGTLPAVCATKQAVLKPSL